MTCRQAINQATDDPERPCAWCLAERQEPANPEDSHGICERHLRAELAKLAERELLSVIARLRAPAEERPDLNRHGQLWRDDLFAQRLEIVLKRVRRIGGTE